MKLISLRIISGDIKRSVSFYEKVIGVKTKWFTEDFAELSTATITLAIGSTRTMQLFGEQLERIAENTGIIIEFRVDRVDEEYKRIKDLTHHIVQEPTTMPWGNRSLLFKDPDGNLINFFTPVTAEAITKFS